jgi:metal-responsive CopG/Arc/MetJ family transcriptional regulator
LGDSREEKAMVRIQLDLPDEQVAQLDELMAETKLRTRKELFNNTLTLFGWAVKEKRAGRVIAAIDQSQDIVKELLMPALENAIPGTPGAALSTSAKGA